jgi:AraC-like DNA-binding protein
MPPIYMDRHDIPGVTAKDVAEAHQEDLKVQDKYGCRGLTYWFDEKRGTAFCLIEAPDKDAVKKMHDLAHGLVPHQLIEVDKNLVEAFLGRIEHPEDHNSDLHSIGFNEPAFRTIMATELKDSALMISKIGVTETIVLLEKHNDIIRTLLKQYDGREVHHSENTFLASFVSASQAVLCAIEIKKSFKDSNSNLAATKLQVQIGISAGVPVTENQDLFGKTVQLARRLCDVTDKGQIMISPLIKNLCQQEGLNITGTKDFIKTLSPADEKFLNQLMDIMEKDWNEAGFDIHDLAQQIGVSKSQLYRKTISLTGFSPNDFIKEFKLHKALKLIEKQQGNISETAYQSGFTSPSYFSKCFQKRFGILPSEFATSIA